MVEATAINELVTICLDMADFAIEQGHIKVQISLADSLPAVMVNRSRSGRVLLCLLRNATLTFS